MSHDPAVIPDELRDLGEIRKVFESTGRSMMVTFGKTLIPVVTGAAMIAAAEIWFVPRRWPYYLLAGLGAVMLLNALRLIIKGWLRRRQKVAIGERGFALWRNDVLTTYRWDQVEEVDAGGENFFGFTVKCQSDDGRTESIKFDAYADTLGNLRNLWQTMEEEAGKGRIPAALDKLHRGEELIFGQKIWGKHVAVKLGVHRFGLLITPRYDKTSFYLWSAIEKIKVNDGRLRIWEEGDDSPILEAPHREVPGYLTFKTVAEQAQQEYLALRAEVYRERLADMQAAIKEGQELTFAGIGVSKDGLRYESELVPWGSVNFVLMEFDHLLVGDQLHKAERQLPIDKLDLADRVMLSFTLTYAQFRTDDEDEEDDEDELDEEDRAEEPTR